MERSFDCICKATANTNRQTLAHLCVDTASRSIGLEVHSFCWSKQRRPSVGVLGRHSGVFVFPSVPEVSAGRRQCRQLFFLVPFLVFSAVVISSVFERVTSVVSVL